MKQTPEHGWTCFHCDETFHSAQCAENHFGDAESCIPACIVNGQEGLVAALRRAEGKNWRLEGRIETLECVEAGLLDGYQRIGGAKDAYEAFCNFDTMEGRAIAAEALIADITERWPSLVEASRRRVGSKKVEISKAA